MLAEAPLALDRACDRWRELYRAAIETRETPARDRHRPVPPAGANERSASGFARRPRPRSSCSAAERRPRSALQSDFYSYRYFASEGFLPGYSFPRLPLSAFIPARRGRAGKDEFLQRPRFLAISEFGPRSIVYHEGSRYVINRVFLPVERDEDNRLPTIAVKQCSSCGYLHPVANGDPGPTSASSAARRSTLRSTQPVPPAERRRRGAATASTPTRRSGSGRASSSAPAVRFAERDGIGQPDRPRRHRRDDVGEADLRRRGDALADQPRLDAPQEPEHQYGFVLDTERGYWAKNDAGGRRGPGRPDEPAPGARRPLRRGSAQRAALRAGVAPSQRHVMASLAAALKSAIQVTFDLEDSELAVEPLPNRDFRDSFSSTRRPKAAPACLRQLASDPTRSRGSRATRSRALPLRPRHRRRSAASTGRARGLRGRLLRLPAQLRQPVATTAPRPPRDPRPAADARHARRSQVSPGSLPRAEQLERLLGALRLGARASGFVDSSTRDGSNSRPTRSDVVDGAEGAGPTSPTTHRYTVVFVDGPPHDSPDVQERDRQATDRLEDAGYT